MSTRLFVGGLSDAIQQSDLQDHFRECGAVKDVYLKKGFAFVEFEDSREAQGAIDKKHQSELAGSRITVQAARERQRRDFDGGDRRGGGSYGGGYGEDRRGGGSYGGGYGEDRRGGGGGYGDERRGGGYDRPARRDDRGSGDYYDRPRRSSRSPGRGGYGGDRPSYGGDRPSYGGDRPSYGGDRPAVGRFQRARSTQHRVQLSGLPSGASWQDIKDFFRDEGLQPTYTVVSRDGDGTGEAHFGSHSEMESAVEKMRGRDMKGAPVTLKIMDEQENAYGNGGSAAPSGGHGGGSWGTQE